MRFSKRRQEASDFAVASADLISYVQYMGSGFDDEANAVAQGLWLAGDYHFLPVYEQTLSYFGPGAGKNAWSAGASTLGTVNADPLPITFDPNTTTDTSSMDIGQIPTFARTLQTIITAEDSDGIDNGLDFTPTATNKTATIIQNVTWNGQTFPAFWLIDYDAAGEVVGNQLVWARATDGHLYQVLSIDEEGAVTEFDPPVLWLPENLVPGELYGDNAGGAQYLENTNVTTLEGFSNCFQLNAYFAENDEFTEYYFAIEGGYVGSVSFSSDEGGNFGVLLAAAASPWCRACRNFAAGSVLCRFGWG